MASIKYSELVKESNEFSKSVSAAIRGIAFGTIGAIWAVFSAAKITWSEFAAFDIPTEYFVQYAFILASASLLLDLIQYLINLWVVRIGLKRWDAQRDLGEKVEFYYNETYLGGFGNWLYEKSPYLFYFKVVLGLGAGIAFVLFTFTIKLVSLNS